jgi:hypothetical protein
VVQYLGISVVFNFISCLVVILTYFKCEVDNFVIELRPLHISVPAIINYKHSQSFLFFNVDFQCIMLYFNQICIMLEFVVIVFCIS